AHGLEGPSLRHWFGTTQLGQDVFAQTTRGLQKSLVIGLLTAFFSTGTAAVVGSCAGYFGGWADRILMWIVDLLLVLPSFLIIAATLNVGGAILAETGLSFFGFGVQTPDVSLGTLIADGQASFLTYPWLFLFAAGILVVAVLSVNVVGDGLRDAL